MYGAEHTTKVIDDDGSTVTTKENKVAGEVVRPVRKYYEIKTRVHNQKEEHEAYIKFSDEFAHDKSMLDTTVKIERSKVGDTNGYYYVVKCYTQLEY